jgi:Uri superfamily endonuclease
VSGQIDINFCENNPAAAAELPATPGAYLVWLRCDRPVALAGRFAGTVLAPGTYLYFGSARGPGGLRARVQRHLRADKRPRWHLDQLTAAAGVRLAARVWPGGGECAWRRAVQARGAAVPVPGFGSSDCRQCPAHLLRLEAEAADPRLDPPDDMEPES